MLYICLSSQFIMHCYGGLEWSLYTMNTNIFTLLKLLYMVLFSDKKTFIMEVCTQLRRQHLNNVVKQGLGQISDQ